MSVPTDKTGSQGLGPLSLGLSYTLAGIATFTVIARFIIKRRTSKNWSLDDWIMLLALAIQFVFQAFFHEIISWGGGLPFDQLDPLQKQQTSKWGWISAVPSILVSCIARISITILLVRIFGVRRWLKWYLILFTSFLSVLSLLSIIFLVAQCVPFYGLWTPMIKAKRWNPYIYPYTAIATQFLYALSDLTFVLFPVLVISKLNMPRRRKIALATILALSLITLTIITTKIAVALLRLTTQVTSVTLVRYYQTLTNLFAALEQWLVIIMGCIPTLKIPAHFKLPTLEDMGSWVASLVPSSWSTRSRQSSAYNSADNNSSFQELELVPKLRIPDEAKPYTVTLGAEKSDLSQQTTPDKKIMQRTEFSVEYN
ncbi:hypothetical protein F5B22DRAFT_579817 [Xylaria bambusicola]|uniref:uncharacterized protein n=1 Tax=Xylaria bambusicola TaxID=326684 RepID=UPI002008E46F|nr:uncharacterized protein F5B22DRAFT_579817 [Xylaria bambusicola]KAI0502945.1 hypothetical protein F5B22DRAFT_579817 [Xylaria bambusicola]